MNAVKKTKIGFLKEYNIDKTDLIIYSVSLGLLLILILAYVFVSKDFTKKMNEKTRMEKRLVASLELKDNAAAIRSDFEKLGGRAEALNDGFLEPTDIADFVEYIKNLATRYNGVNISASPQAKFVVEKRFVKIPADIANYLQEKGVYREGDMDQINADTYSVPIQVSRQTTRISMEMTLGNLVALLSCFEHSSKIIEVSSLSLGSLGESDKVRIDMTVNGYGITDIFRKQLNAAVPEISKQLKTKAPKLLIEYPKVGKVIKTGRDPELRYETVTVTGQDVKIRAVFGTPPPPPVKPVMPPPGLVVEVIVGDLVAFKYNSLIYYAKTGAELEAKGSKKGEGFIPGYKGLKLTKIDQPKGVVRLQVIWQGEALTGDLPIKKTTKMPGDVKPE